MEQFHGIAGIEYISFGLQIVCQTEPALKIAVRHAVCREKMHFVSHLLHVFAILHSFTLQRIAAGCNDPGRRQFLQFTFRVNRRDHGISSHFLRCI